jgi:hypothetical protein
MLAPSAADAWQEVRGEQLARLQLEMLARAYLLELAPQWETMVAHLGLIL